ncbi:17958_t:CDS:2 [Racocetra persica]|uniref:17958_t:CDS:1 n=1 Tax=Racocetra persica TaxID=160502 RepID=A0ACA9KBR2_9GLOM|nr:17958_t:CDS:2 [Racocetra persica]
MFLISLDISSETNVKEQRIENQIEDNLRENDLKKNDLKKNDLKKNDLRENDLREDNLKEDGLKKNGLRKNSLEEDNSYAKAPDENSTSIKIVTSTEISHKDNENDFERYNFPQETFIILYNSSNEFEAANDEIFSNTTEISSNTTEISSNTTNSYDFINLLEIHKNKIFTTRRMQNMASWFDVYCYKLHVAILNLAVEFSETHEIEGEPSISELSEFISEDVWKKVLQLHLKATDYPVLKNDPVMFTKLGTFVYQAVKKVLVVINSEQNTRNTIRKYDEITLDL